MIIAFRQTIFVELLKNFYVRKYPLTLMSFEEKDKLNNVKINLTFPPCLFVLCALYIYVSKHLIYFKKEHHGYHNFRQLLKKARKRI